MEGEAGARVGSEQLDGAPPAVWLGGFIRLGLGWGTGGSEGWAHPGRRSA